MFLKQLTAKKKKKVFITINLPSVWVSDWLDIRQLLGTHKTKIEGNFCYLRHLNGGEFQASNNNFFLKQ